MYLFPYTNFHDINLDWIIRELEHVISDSTVFHSVKFYGAVGDGITDDTEAIRTCFENENYVIFPEGSYLITDRIVIDSDNKFVIGFPNATIIEDNGWFAFTEANNFKIANLKFEYANNKPTTNIVFWKCLNVEICNCEFSDGYNFNVQCSTCGRVKIHDCIFNGTEYHTAISLSIDVGFETSVYGTGGWTIIRDCEISNGGLDGIIANNYNVIIDKCIIKSCGTRAKAAGIYSNTKSNLTITNCRISGCSGNGIDIVGCAQLVIDGCWCGANECAGIFLGSAVNATIQNCHCNNNGSDPIDAYQDSGIVISSYNSNNSHNVRVGNCFAQNNANYGYRFLNADGVMINALFAYGNTTGDREILTSVSKADYTSISV